MKLGIPFIHKRSSRTRSVKVHVEADGTVVVTTPVRFSASEVPHYIEEARAWIEKRLIEVKKKPQLITSTSVYYFGEVHELVINSDMDGSVRVDSGKIHLSPLIDSTSKRIELLEKWLKNRAIEYCLPRLDFHAGRMGVKFNQVRFKQQRTCWGSCSSDKNLNFNWRLIHAPKEVIDYVIIHELAHLTHMNHGNQFWDLVAKYDPDHPLHRGWLKRFGGETE